MRLEEQLQRVRHRLGLMCLVFAKGLRQRREQAPHRKRPMRLRGEHPEALRPRIPLQPRQRAADSQGRPIQAPRFTGPSRADQTPAAERQVAATRAPPLQDLLPASRGLSGRSLLPDGPVKLHGRAQEEALQAGSNTRE